MVLSEEYNFLRNNDHLGDRIILIGLGGSHAYGTNNETSDLDGNRQPIPEFFEMVDDYEKKMKYAKENTDLPENPDYKAIQEFVMDVNERVVRGLI